MLKSAATKVFGSSNDRYLKRKAQVVKKINALEPTYKAMSDEELSNQTNIFKERLAGGETLDELLSEAFAVTREAAVRVLGMRHFDVQLIGGMVLHEGKIAEMKTGEGKTLVATLPVYLNALAGKGVHVVTVNDYLATRDAEWMGRVYEFLGLSTGVVVTGMSHQEKAAAYRADVTYGQNNEYGFDYLRDNMKIDLDEMAQREHAFAIVDEVDSILIDEARTPLIISGGIDDPTENYKIANAIIPQLSLEQHFTIEEKSKEINLTEEGVARVEQLLGIENLYDIENIAHVHHVNNALRAHNIQRRDVDYVVRDGKVIIVDEFTGRLMDGRRWSNGLHQAVEAKEGVEIAQENQTLASITFQNYFRMYDKLSGMTGTADTEAVEFKKIYNLDVVVIPTNKPIQRKDFTDVVYISEDGKFKSVCKDIAECHKTGQPVLAGTASIAKSELLSRYLNSAGIPHNVLNAKHHEREADIVAQAGRLGSVTIATNMAGRGTDIVLGGNAEFLTEAEIGEDEVSEEKQSETLSKFQKQCSEERAKVLDAGGLHIVGTERHESRRIDNQLRGRSGRQGDPGSSRFYVSLQDDLMRRFGGDRMQAIVQRFGMAEEDAIEGKLVGRAIENAQKKVEDYHLGFREQILKYDNVMNQQRNVVYSLRGRLLKGEAVAEELETMIPDCVHDMIMSRIDEKLPVSEWDVDGILEVFKRIFGMEVSKDLFQDAIDSEDKRLAQYLYDKLKDIAEEALGKREEFVGREAIERNAKIFYLQAINHFWREHLANMDHLKEGIGLRGYGQRDPLREYQREAYALFENMLASIRDSVVFNLFNKVMLTEQEVREIEERERELQKQREEAAKAVHQDFGGEGGPEEKASSGNRAQRRRAAAKSEESKTGAESELPEASSAVGDEEAAQAAAVSKNALKRRRKNQRKGKR